MLVGVGDKMMTKGMNLSAVIIIPRKMLMIDNNDCVDDTHLGEEERCREFMKGIALVCLPVPVF